MVNVNITGATRNQSTATYTQSNLCLFDNRFDKADITGAASIKVGHLVARDTASGKVVLGTASNLAKVIGVSVDGFELPASTTAKLNYVVSGTINQTVLVLPATVTLNTPIAEGGILLKDHLNSLGFHLENVVENTY